MISGDPLKLEQFLFEKFSYRSFRPGQREIIESVLEGHDTLAVLPTGSGKSLCYQLPGLMRKGTTLIISPLLSLMQDQVEQLKMKGEKRVVALNSFLAFPERTRVLHNLATFKFIYISPEMLQNEQILAALQKLSIQLFVVDEAHCISQWGYDFRPDYLSLGAIRRALNNPQVLALTATARKRVREDIKFHLQIADAKEFIFSIDRPNIALVVEKLSVQAEKQERLFELVKHLQGPGIIYFSSKKMADHYAERFQKKGMRVASYHSEIDQEQRILLQQQFLYGELDLICATSAFGMGVNKEDVRYCIHFHPPVDLESYFQEIGRAGRDGKNSVAIMLYCPDDLYLQQQLISSELPDHRQIYQFARWKMDVFPHQGNNKKTESREEILPEFTETQWRLLEKFFSQVKDKAQFIPEITSFVENRLAFKQAQLQKMTNWVNASGCRRKNLLHYFEESEKEHVSPCCDHCGVDLTIFYRKEQKVIPAEEFHWRRQLKKLFNKNE